MEKSLGEVRMRTDFNVSNSDAVTTIKLKCAALINEAQRISEEANDGEVRRLCALAMTEIESAGMWLVKAATAQR